MNVNFSIAPYSTAVDLSEVKAHFFIVIYSLKYVPFIHPAICTAKRLI